MSKTEEKGANRRDFLKLAAASAPAAAVAATATGAQADTAMESTGEGLRDTAHTRAYFESARF